ncbi:MAG: LPXTG cell wall anchor domain-containing protein [Ilumatobacteraceae bacterium]
MHTSSRRTAGRLTMFLVGTVITIVGAVAGTAGVASAHHPLIEASATCNGTVTFTATAWTPEPPFNEPGHRTNPNITVAYQVDGVGSSTLVGTGAFTPQNNFTFSGQFTWPDGASSLKFTATAVGDWEIGVTGGQTWEFTLPKPAMPCVEESTTTSSTTTSSTTSTTILETTTTSTLPATTTTEVGSESPTTTSTTIAATTTTDVSSEGPTTTISRTLPRTGSGTTMSLPLLALGLLMIGSSVLMTVRRRNA